MIGFLGIIMTNIPQVSSDAQAREVLQATSWYLSVGHKNADWFVYEAQYMESGYIDEMECVGRGETIEKAIEKALQKEWCNLTPAQQARIMGQAVIRGLF